MTLGQQYCCSGDSVTHTSATPVPWEILKGKVCISWIDTETNPHSGTYPLHALKRISPADSDRSRNCDPTLLKYQNITAALSTDDTFLSFPNKHTFSDSPFQNNGLRLCYFWLV